MFKKKPSFMHSKYSIAAIHAAFLSAACLLPALGGCSDSKSAPANTRTATNQPANAAKPDKPADTLEREIWDVCFLQGVRVGYVQTSYYKTVQFGKPAVRIEADAHITLTRNGQETNQQFRSTSIETPEGRLLSFKTEMLMGAEPTTVAGRFIGKSLQLETITPGKKTTAAIDWSPDYGGFFAVQQSLIRKPMQPGQRRTLHALAEGFNQLATVEMLARDWQQTPLMHGDYNLLRIDTMLYFPDGNKMEQTVWTDRLGDMLKTSGQPMAMETFRATKEEALQKIDASSLDITLDTVVKLAKPLPDAHDMQRAVYRMHLDGGDPAAAFVAGPTQNIKSLDAETADVTVHAIRPDNDNNKPPSADRVTQADLPTAADRSPNNWIQSDNPKIIALAKEASGGLSDPWAVAVRLEKFVHDYINRKNYSRAFSSAAEVVQTREGDCTENAVLLAALCRARGIPARVAIGLVYVPNLQGFAYHMWTEVFIYKSPLPSGEGKEKSPLPLGESKGEGKEKSPLPLGEGKGEGKWIPIDATLAKGGIGVGHLKLAHSSLKGASAYSGFLPVVQVVGRLKIELIERNEL